MNLFYYLIEANIYLIVFYVCYKLALDKLSFHSLNRFYLLGTTLLAFVLPFFTITSLDESRFVDIKTQSKIVATDAGPLNAAHYLLTPINQALILYALVVLILFSLFFIKLIKLNKLVSSGKITRYKGIKRVELENTGLSFSFLNVLFIDNNIDKAETVIKHEMAHIKQLHSLDILFLELVQILNWFNPAVYLIKSGIKELHEFIADENALDGNPDSKDAYSDFLLENAQRIMSRKLASPIFDRSILKKRLLKLYQDKTKPQAQLRYLFLLLLIPVMILLTTLGCNKPYSFIDIPWSMHKKTSDTLVKDVVVSQASNIQIQDVVLEKIEIGSSPEKNVKSVDIQIKNVVIPPLIEIGPLSKTNKKEKVETSVMSNVPRLELDKEDNGQHHENKTKEEIIISTIKLPVVQLDTLSAN